MRQIKFRAWDSLSSKMYTGHSVSIGANGSIAFCENTGEWIEPEEGRIHVMQFTGLDDKNGKEIYEGDIIKSWYSRDTSGTDIAEHVVKVEFEELSFGSAGYEIPCFENAEVIGNIHENPELLK